tara:strand:- start:6732 stop:6905 length:174 start_codon:yes stop_codon:yes gene_type:complete
MNKKAKFKIGIGSIFATVAISYLVQHWFLHSGVHNKILNKIDDINDFIKNEFKGGSK